jgi:hypothetical protein
VNINRREFIVQSALATGSLIVGCDSLPMPERKKPLQSVAIYSDPKDQIAAAKSSQWATQHLRDSLAKRNISVRLCQSISEPNPLELCILAHGLIQPPGSFIGGPPDNTELVQLEPYRRGGQQFISAGGGGPRGLVYALTELSDSVEFSSDPLNTLARTKSTSERPANQVRSCMRMFCSDIEDKSWFNDREFWKQYLTMLVTHRFNRFQLALGLGYDFAREMLDTYFYFPYPFLLKVPGYDVRATNLPDAERDRNLEMLRFISDEATTRGLHFQLGLWTHAYKWTNSPQVNHNIEGLTDDTHAAYCREALTILLKECPNIAGVTFRIHGESGVTEGSYDFWKTVFDGCVRCGRKVEIDMHAKGMDQNMIDVALATGLPVTISPKYWAEHMGLPYHQAWIRPTELPRGRATGLMALSTGERSFTRYGWGDLLKEDRKYGIIHRMWPGTQRLLLWGDPVFAAAYGRASSFCGSLGCEIMEPLSFKGRKGSGVPGGREAYLDKSLETKYDFEKYSYTYRLWGRLLFNPDADPETWRRELRHDYGEASDDVEKSLASASRILPLITTAHTPSAANNNYWPEIYVNMSLVDDTQRVPYGDTPTPRRFGFVSPLDPQLFSSIDQHADELIKGESSGKYSPIEVAHWLEELALAARLDPKGEPALRRAAIDVSVQSALGSFFAAKLRAGVLYALYEKSNDPDALKQAIGQYRAARAHWLSIIELTKDVYVADISVGIGWFQRGHWSDRLAAIDKDIALLEARANEPTNQPKRAIPELIVAARSTPSRTQVKANHTHVTKFQRGRPVPISITTAASPVALYYRHIDQAEAWQTSPMQRDGTSASAQIPADYSDSPYPLQYYFQLGDESGQRTLYPLFNSTWSNTPYFVIRQT